MTFRFLKSTAVFIILIFSFLGCKTKINQVKNNLQEGKWVTIDTLDYPYITKGKYHKGVAVGSWKYIYKGKLDRKEKYKKNKCLTKFYYPSGKVKQQGYTRLENIDKKAHWFYFGKWYNYDEKGKLIKIDTYENGLLQKTDSIK
jgi:antitoxin component YwqK of YwqJK toxin-antitoxin module